MKTAALKELEKAIAAHGGKYEWVDEDDCFPEDAQPPCVCFLRDSGPVDAEIRSIYVDSTRWEIYARTVDEYNPIDFMSWDPYEICGAFQIQTITEAVPATDKVDDVTITPPKNIKSRIVVDADDLKMRDYDGSRLTSEQFEEIGAKMLSYYLDGAFYDDMMEACFILGIPALENEQEEEG